MAKAQERIEIKFTAKGSQSLILALKQLDVAMKRLEGQTSQYEKELKEMGLTQAQVNKVLKSGTAHTRIQAGAFATLRSNLLLYSFALSLANRFLVKYVDQAGKQEAGLRTLSFVYGDASKGLAEYAQELQKVTTVGDEVTMAGMALMGQMGMTEEQVRKITPLVLDFATVMETDVQNAFLLTAKSLMSSTNALERYNISIDKSASSAQQFTQMQQELGKFAGSSRLMAMTVSGQLQQARNAFGDFGEVIGRAVAPAVLAIAKAMQKMAEAMDVRGVRALLAAMTVLGIAYALAGSKLHIYNAAIAIYNGFILLSTIHTGSFTVALTSLSLALGKNLYLKAAVGLSMLVGAIVYATDTIDSEAAAIEESYRQLRILGGVMDTSTKEQRALIKAKLDHHLALEKELALLNAKTEIEKIEIQQGFKLQENTRAVVEALIAKKNAIKEANEEIQKEEKFLSSLEQAYDRTLEGQLELLESRLVEAEIMMLNNELNAKQIAGFEALGIKYDELSNKIKEQNKVIGDEAAKKKEIQNDLDKETINILFSYIDANNLKNSTIKASLTLEQEKLILDAEATSVQSQFNEGLITREEALLALHDIEQKRIALQEKEIKNTDLINEGMQKLGESMNTLGLQSVVGLATSFQETYDKVLEQTGETEEALKLAWTDLTFEMASMAMEAIAQYSQAETAIIQERASKQMEQLKSSRRFEKMSARQKKKAEKRITDDANAKLRKQFEVQQAMNAASVVMDTAAAIIKLQVNPGFPAGLALAVMMGVMGAAQLAIINQQKAPTMAQGGLVGGFPHSQGGTMINAERGEFVMSRRAVETAGLETMNRINAGMGGGGSINVTFSGNINSDEFIESEAIPKIREAIRRGADIGEV